ncbi:MAG: efflux RND transporter periplasmic adaptor subunit [Alphaproteobacteria bacterium]|nr:efflux RND transporter periplasmic adaptor subunit [Alphaproteobacteria bacterium]
MAKRILKLVLPLIILALAIAGAGYLRATKPGLTPKAPVEKVWPVSAVEAAPSDIKPELRVFGEIVAGREVEMRPLVAGRVVETGPDFVEGGVLRRGDLLVAIDPFDYDAKVTDRTAALAEARAKLREIEAELKAYRTLLVRDREQVALRRRDVKRRESLVRGGITSEKTLDDARLILSEQRQKVTERKMGIERHKARLEQQRAVIERLEVEVRQARRDLEETRLTAPFDGFIIDVSTEIGKRVSEGDRVARLIDANRLEARFHLSNDQFGRLLQAGGYRDRPARVLWRIGGEAYSFDATIERIGGEIDPTSGGVDMFARIRASGTETSLRPGAFVEVYLSDRLYRDVVRLPESALHGNDVVYVAAEGRLVARRIELVLRVGNDVLVRGPFEPGDRVVTTRFPEIGPGLRVEIR